MLESFLDKRFLTTETVEIDWNIDGTITDKEVATYFYDIHGRLSSKTSVVEQAGRWQQPNSSVTSTTWDYDASSNLTAEISEYDGNSDGVIDSWSATTKTYDASGNLTAEISENDWNGDGIIDSRSATTKTYNASSNLASDIYESDENSDGIIDSRSATKKTYDASSNLTAEISETDWNSDGIVDYRSATTKTYAYDASGHLTSEISETDWNSDGIVDSRSATTKTYDASGNLTSDIYESDENSDGVVDYRSATTKTYDDNGHLTSKISEYDRNRSGTADYRTIEVYDSNGKLASRTTEDNVENYGKGIYQATTTYNYDLRGNLTSKAFESNEPALYLSPVIYRSLETYAYDSSGQVATKISEVDSWGAWKIPESRQITTSTYSTIFKVDSVLLDLSHISGYLPTEFTLSINGDFDNFSGFYKVIDENGGIDVNNDQIVDLVPGDQGYTQAALNNSQPSIALTTENGQTSVFVNELQGGSLYAPFFIANGNPNSFNQDEIYFAFTAANADGLEHIKFENGSLFYEETAGGGDNDFNDSVITVQFLLNERPTLINLTDLTGLADVEFTLSREAAYDNFVGFYRVTDENGGIDVDGDGVADLLPGDKGYAEAALANYETNVALVTADSQTSVFVNELAGGTFYAPFLVANGRPADPNSFAMEEVYFAFTVANADGVEHIRFQDGGLYCEDLAGGGDNDFNDAVVQMAF